MILMFIDKIDKIKLRYLYNIMKLKQMCSILWLHVNKGIVYNLWFNEQKYIINFL